MKVRRTRRQAAQNRTFGFADIHAVAADQCSTRISHVEDLACQRSRVTFQSEDRQTTYVEGGRERVGDADIQRRLNRMIANVGSVVAGAAKAWNVRYPGDIVETRNVLDSDGACVEELLAAR